MSYYSDPTANQAIGNVYREEKRREEALKILQDAEDLVAKKGWRIKGNLILTDNWGNRVVFWDWR